MLVFAFTPPLISNSSRVDCTALLSFSPVCSKRFATYPKLCGWPRILLEFLSALCLLHIRAAIPAREPSTKEGFLNAVVSFVRARNLLLQTWRRVVSSREPDPHLVEVVAQPHVVASMNPEPDPVVAQIELVHVIVSH